MEELKNKTLTLFFTFKISLETWMKVGNLGRETKLYNELAKHFKKIYFITYGNKKELDFQKELAANIKILPKLSFLPSVIYQFFIPFIYHKELEETDVYKTNQMAAAIPAIISKWLYRKKLIVRCGYELLNFLEKEEKPFWKKVIVSIIERIVYRNADRIILTSTVSKQFIEKKFRVPQSKIEIIPNYVDTKVFKPLADIKKDALRIVSMGRLANQKNFFSLVDAILGTPYKLTIIGQGPLKGKIRNKKSNIHLIESVPNEKLPEELNKSEIFILPSLYEGCPKALLEAMSCGLPCIGTDVEGIREIIRHKRNGYLCGTDAISIKKAVIEVLNDKSLQKELSENARKTILEKFSLERISEEEINIYETL